MYANSVLPPFEGTLRAWRIEYFAGTTLNELSECQRRLPIPKSRRRSSRADRVLLVQIRHVGERRRHDQLVTSAARSDGWMPRAVWQRMDHLAD